MTTKMLTHVYALYKAAKGGHIQSIMVLHKNVMSIASSYACLLEMKKDIIVYRIELVLDLDHSGDILRVLGVAVQHIYSCKHISALSHIHIPWKRAAESKKIRQPDA